MSIETGRQDATFDVYMSASKSVRKTFLDSRHRGDRDLASVQKHLYAFLREQRVITVF